MKRKEQHESAQQETLETCSLDFYNWKTKKIEIPALRAHE